MFKKLAVAALAGALLAPLSASAAVNLTAAGSTALLPLVKESAQSYQEKHSDVKIAVSGGGSSVGISQAMSKAVDIGDSDIIARGDSGLKDHKVCVVAFAIIAHPETGVTNLKSDQIRGIFSGKITNWKEVGGKDQSIVVINRPRSSGTRAVFNATIMGASKINESGLVEDSSGTVVKTVGSTPGSISYVAYGYTRNQPITVMKINNQSLTDDNVRSGKYPIWSYEHMFTHAGSPKEAEDFINYLANNKEVIEKLGFILINTMHVKEANR